jgi:epoxyqueuosine reductase
MSDPLKERIRQCALSAGYSECGICSALPFTEYEAALRERMRRFPEAAHLYGEMLRKADPRLTAPWARSVVVCVRGYNKYRVPGGLDRYIARNYLCDRRVPQCPDHRIPGRMKEGLRALGLRAKKGGVPERAAGARAGVTRFGRNAFAYTDTEGSWINIESFRIDAELEPDTPSSGVSCPEGCRACIDACPTQALAEPFTVRIDRCVAYLTYGAPEPIAPDLWEKMGQWIYGCDACQHACPLNAGKWRPEEPMPWIERNAPCFSPASLAAMDQQMYETIVRPLFWYIPSDNAARWRRNAVRAKERRQPLPSHQED